MCGVWSCSESLVLLSRCSPGDRGVDGETGGKTRVPEAASERVKETNEAPNEGELLEEDGVGCNRHHRREDEWQSNGTGEGGIWRWCWERIFHATARCPQPKQSSPAPLLDPPFPPIALPAESPYSSGILSSPYSFGPANPQHSLSAASASLKSDATRARIRGTRVTIGQDHFFYR